MSKNQLKPEVDFIGIGAKKAATSWLARCLAEHPDICMPAEKELHFFSLGRNYKKGVDEYLKAFKLCASNKVSGEFSTSYLDHPETPERIKEHFPQTKFIVILRHPVSRALSHIRHLVSRGKLPEGIRAEKAVQMFPHILEAGLYATNLKRWFSFFPRAQVLILFADDIQSNPRNEIEKTYAFLNVREDFIPPSLHIRYNTSAVRGHRFFKPMNKVYKKLKKKKMGKWLLAVARRMNLFLLFNKYLSKESNDSIDSKSEDRRYLEYCYKEEIVQLEALLNKDLHTWKIR